MAKGDGWWVGSGEKASVAHMVTNIEDPAGTGSGGMELSHLALHRFNRQQYAECIVICSRLLAAEPRHQARERFSGRARALCKVGRRGSGAGLARVLGLELVMVLSEG